MDSTPGCSGIQQDPLPPEANLPTSTSLYSNGSGLLGVTGGSGLCGSDRVSLNSTTTLISTSSTATYGSATSGETTATGPVRYVLSGIKPELSYPETVAVFLLFQLTPLLADPVSACRPTHLITHLTMHGVGIAAGYLVALFAAALFAELHHYYRDCGGLVSVARKVCGSVLSVIVMVTVAFMVISQVAVAMVNLTDLLERQTDYFFSDYLHNWTDGVSRLHYVTALILLLILLTSLLGTTIITRVSLLLVLVTVPVVVTISGYGIAHSLSTPTVHSPAANPEPSPRALPLTRYPEPLSDNISVLSRYYREADPVDLLDYSIQSYIFYTAEIAASFSSLTLLVSLTEDIKLPAATVNAIGGVVVVVCSGLGLLFNLSLAHVTSTSDVYVDEVTLTVGVPSELVLFIAVLTGTLIVAKTVLILFTGSRALHGLVIGLQETGIITDGLLCKLTKVPAIIIGTLCFLSAPVLLLHRVNVLRLSLICTFVYLGLAGFCHLLHRYSTSNSDPGSETAPILGTWGSVKADKLLNTLLGLMVLFSVLLGVAGVVGGEVQVEGYVWRQVVMLVWIVIGLGVIGCVSVIASFQQIAAVHNFYTRLVWTPLVPSFFVVAACLVLVFNYDLGFSKN